MKIIYHILYSLLIIYSIGAIPIFFAMYYQGFFKKWKWKWREYIDSVLLCFALYFVLIPWLIWLMITEHKKVKSKSMKWIEKNTFEIYECSQSGRKLNDIEIIEIWKSKEVNRIPSIKFKTPFNKLLVNDNGIKIVK